MKQYTLIMFPFSYNFFVFPVCNFLTLWFSIYTLVSQACLPHGQKSSNNHSEFLAPCPTPTFWVCWGSWGELAYFPCLLLQVLILVVTSALLSQLPLLHLLSDTFLMYPLLLLSSPIVYFSFAFSEILGEREISMFDPL